jgi:4-amino-4-deoxy-L-arabinose transferase-like glycosyltransferase
MTILAGAALRLVGLGRNSFWTDELYVVWEGRQPLDVLFNPMLHVQHPPGYRLALHMWMGPGTAETWIRLLPALAGIALIPVVWALAKTLWPEHESAAGLAALFVATSPFLLHYSQDATNYSWTILWVALSALLLINAWHKDRGWLWAAWAVTLAVASYSYYYTIFPIMLEAGAAICVGLWGMRRKHEGAARRLLHAALAVVVALILYAPWAVVLILNRDAIQTPLFPLYWDGYPVVWIPQLLVGFPNDTFWQSPWGLYLGWAIFLVGTGYLLLRMALRRTPGTMRALAVFLWGLASILGAYIAQRIITPSPAVADWVRFTAFAAPALLLGIAALLVKLRPPFRVIAVGVWLLLAVVQWQGELTAPPRQDWRGVYSTLSAQAKQGDAFLAFTAFHAGAAAAYYPLPVQVEGGWFTGDGDNPTGAAYWFPPGWQWRGFLNPVAYRSTDWQTEIEARTVGAARVWYLAGDGSDGTYPPNPTFESALSSLGWRLSQEWQASPLTLKLYVK